MSLFCESWYKNEDGTNINPQTGPFYYYFDMIIVDEDFQKQVNPVTMKRELLTVDGDAGEHRDMWDKFMVVKYPEIKLKSIDNHKGIPRGRVDCKIKNGQLVFWVTLDKCIVDKETEIIRQFHLDNYETEFYYGTMNYVCENCKK